MKKQKPIIVPAAKVRNVFALHALMRKAGKMKDRRAPKGGNRNKQRDLKEEE